MKRLLILSMIISSYIFAAPEQIIVVRHCDKYDIQPLWSQSSLSPKGYIRAIALAKYYLKNFGHPDFVISANTEDPVFKNGEVTNKYSLSIKEIQTAGPLLSMLNKEGINVAEIFYHPYIDSKTTEITNFIMGNDKFNNKKILVIWDHFQIPTLIHKLGVKESVVVTQPADVFDNVYILEYDPKGNLVNYTEKKHQYPVPDIESWNDLYDKVISKK